jgi:hypothetical protein
MSHKTIELPMFFVAGISVRTINQDGHADKDIGGLWQKFTQEKLADKLEDKEGEELYCVYTNYEGDHTGYYTAILKKIDHPFGLWREVGDPRNKIGFRFITLPAEQIWYQ